MTENQKKLADLFLDTKTHAKVVRRKKEGDGSFSLYDTTRDTSPIDFPVNDEEFAIKAHEKDITAPLSPIYVNLRNLPDEMIDLIGRVLAEVVVDKKFAVCTGIPKTALAMAQAFAAHSGVEFIDIFDKVGTDTKREIKAKPDAAAGQGKHLVIIDDVISQGGSKVEAIKAAEDLGYQVSILVLINREQGGSKQLEEQGYKVYSAFYISELLSYFLQKEKITDKQYRAVKNYLNQS